MEAEKIKNYVDRLGGSDTLYDKIITVKRIADQICPEEIADIFISEKPTGSGFNPVNVWFFSERYCLESKEVLSSKINLDIMSFFRYITRLELNSFNYNFEEATDESQLNIEGFTEGVILNMIATSSNCDHLWSLVTKYMSPNIYEYEEEYKEEVEEEAD